MHTLTMPAFSDEAANTTLNRLNSLAKLPGSLGSLEHLCVRLAGITDNPCPQFPRKAVVLFAADHHIALHGLSSTGQEITEIQVRNFLQGGGTINAFCRNAGAHLTVVDVGVKRDLHDAVGLVQRKVVYGANDFSQEAAMTREQAQACLQVGIDMAREEVRRGITLLAAGEMGIGNTSPSSALAAVFTGASIEKVTSVGSGIPAEKLQLKINLLKKALELHKPNPTDPMDVLAKVGGPELGAMAGLMLGGAALRVPVVVDGFIAGAAAALAVALCPDVRHLLVGSHLSDEPGHRILMEHLAIPTYIDFSLRLGEGTGAALMFPMIDASVRILAEMRTLAELGFKG